jgi:WD40 repeat protein
MKDALQAKKKAALNHAKELEESKQDIQKKPEFVIPDSEVRDFIASGSRDKSIRIWDAKNGRQIATLIGHDNWINELCFHPNNKHLISVSDDKSLRVWDLTTTRCHRKLLNIHGHFVTSVAVKQKTVITASVD